MIKNNEPDIRTFDKLTAQIEDEHSQFMLIKSAADDLCSMREAIRFRKWDTARNKLSIKKTRMRQFKPGKKFEERIHQKVHDSGVRAGDVGKG